MERFTVCTAVDEAHLRQLEVSACTWSRNRPEMADLPFVIVFDRDQVTESRVADVFRSVWRRPPELTLVPWPLQGIEYGNQRAKMLSAYVHAVPAAVKTRWWVKIDTDAIAMHHDPRWVPIEDMRSNAVVLAPKWHYCKPPNQVRALDEWGDGVPGLQDRPRLNIPVAADDNKCRYARFCSWVQFTRQDWSCEVASYCPHGWLPVPSQDGFHSYCVLRRGDPWRKYPARDYGWTNASRFSKLKMMAAAALDMAEEIDQESDTREYVESTATT